MRPKPSFEQAAQMLQNAAVDPTQWTAAMDMLSTYSGSIGAVLLPLKGRGPGTPHSPSLDEPYEAYFREGWHLRDERDSGLSFIRRKGIFVDQDYVTPDKIATSDYYRGFLDKFNNNWSATIGFADPEDQWTLSFQRGKKQGLFEENEQNDLVRLAGPLRQAAALGRSVAYANAAGALDAYEAVGCASFLINQLGRVVRYNAQAEALLGDGLQLSNGTLRCFSRADTLALEKLIDSLRLWSGYTPNPQLVAARRETKRPLVIRAIALSGLAAMVFSSAKIILLISDAEKFPSPGLREIQGALRLSNSEARLALALINGDSLVQAAERIGVSHETARSHLKTIFAKTNTNRQNELVALLNRIFRFS